MSCFGASVMVAIIGILTRGEAALHPAQVVFFRNVTALVFFMPWVFYFFRKEGNFNHLKTTQIKLHSLRVIFGTAGLYLWTCSLALVPHPTAVALSFTSPLITATLAVLLLGDRFGWHRSMALGFGFVGAMIILRPGMEGFNQYSWLVLGAATVWAIAGIIIKKLTEVDSSRLVVFYMVVVGTPLTLPVALIYWRPVPVELWFWVVALGGVSALFQISMTHAFSLAPFSVILPFDFTRLLFTSILSYFVFNEILDFWTFIGATLIMASAVYATWRQAKRAKQAQISQIWEEERSD